MFDHNCPHKEDGVCISCYQSLYKQISANMDELSYYKNELYTRDVKNTTRITRLRQLCFSLINTQAAGIVPSNAKVTGDPHHETNKE